VSGIISIILVAAILEQGSYDILKIIIDYIGRVIVSILYLLEKHFNFIYLIINIITVAVI